ncbi:MAG: (d)CMP kinase [Firmicutes bacterium]|nr:(d)CMP kinase [Bacillota bacterium]MCM1401107.1 (d)CMP kinase [Bacteroides sp.]MCM1477070.1 (d)CMP kinase [Bacteroides sp.]
MITSSNQPLITIAIDGYSSSGKSTMAKQLAKKIGYRYIDSGAMYRAVTLYALRKRYVSPGTDVDSQALIKELPSLKIEFEVKGNEQFTLLNGENVESEIRSMAVSQCVSPIAAIPEVRHALVALQQQLGENKGIVMDGRDIGTNVFPHAELKIFVNASAQTRAQRRLAEMVNKGIATTYEEVLANVVSRDHIDETRKESPLRQAPDAIVIDNSTMSVEAQNQWLLNQFRNTISNLSE